MSEWVLFSRFESGMPKVVSAAVVEPHERERLPFALTARIPYQAQANGLPADGQLQKATAAEEYLEGVLKAQGALHVGHVTFNGVLRAIFYAPAPGPASVQVRQGLFRKIPIEIDSREDRDWSLFELELSPTPLEMEGSRNRQLLHVLASKGDLAAKPRPVDFAARFPTTEARASFVEAVSGEGFALSPGENALWEPEAGDYWCEIVKTTTVDPDTINAATLYLRKQARAAGGEFDGWQTPLITS